jgi:hypothetical protein
MLPGSASKEPLEPDGRYGAGDGEDRIEVGDLAVRIEERDQQQPAERASGGPDDEFERHEVPAPWAPMIVREMPFAARTRGHKSEKRGRLRHDSTP